MLNSKKLERENLLEITKGQEALYVQYIASQQQAQSQVEVLWKVASDKYQESFDTLLSQYNCADTNKTNAMFIECARIIQFFKSEKELAKSEIKEATSNVLDWPIESHRITTFFHDASYYQALHSQHDAIDIGTPQGTDITAPADGYIYYALEPTATGYSYLAMKHRDGLVTVYGHLSEIKVAKYEFVKK